MSDTQAKHTPGPWHVNQFTPRLVSCKEGNIAKCQSEANALFIAAAPELLMEAMELLRNATYADGQAIVLTQDCEALEAVIARAIGKL